MDEHMESAEEAGRNQERVYAREELVKEEEQLEKEV